MRSRLRHAQRGCATRSEFIASMRVVRAGLRIRTRIAAEGAELCGVERRAASRIIGGGGEIGRAHV